MIDINPLLEADDPAAVESLTKNLLTLFLEEIHAPVGVEKVWGQVESASRFQDMKRYWPGWNRSYRERQWEAWCREVETLAYSSRPYCLLCGECCRKGSPSLYAEDLPALRAGVIRRSDLVTLRFGEIGYSPIQNDLVLISEERVKIKEQPGSQACLFFEPDENRCRIYENRPLQCRTMECWNPAGFQSLEGLKFLSRKDLLNPDDPLLPVIESHGQRCDLTNLHQILSRIRKGGAFSQQEVLDMVFFDDHLREFLAEKQGIGEEHHPFLFGRSLKDLLPVFGLQLEAAADGTVSVHPTSFEKEKTG